MRPGPGFHVRRGVGSASLIATLLGTCVSIHGLQSPRLEAPLQSERERSIDVLHYRIELSLEESDRSIDGTATIRFRSLREGLRSFELDAETFAVRAVRGPTGDLDFEHQRGTLRVHLGRPLPFGGEANVEIDYGGSGIDVDATAYGMAASYDLGLDFKEANERHPALINTLSFPEGARHWFPSLDHPSDRATQEVLATVRADYEVLSNGRLMGIRELDDSRRQWHYLQERPHPTYLFVLVAGPYRVIEDEWRGIPVNYWVYPRDEEHAMRSFHRTKDILDFFVEEYGHPYPWVKYDQITIPGIGGGAESTGATVLGESTIHDARADRDFPSHWLVAHEAAHQWWGNLVSYRDWGETWLSESFATYSEYLWAKHDLGPDEGAWNLHLKRQSYFDEARTRYRRPIVYHRWRYPNENFDRHTYQKGAVILNLLRWELGDEAFRAVLASFLREHAYQPVATSDLMQTIKDVAGRNFDGFFEQWVFGPGHPSFEVSSEWLDGRLKLVVRQTQDTGDGTHIFRTPVEIGIHHAGRALRREIIHVDEASEEFVLEVPEKPDLVRFDQGSYLLKELDFQKPIDEWLFQLEHDDVMGQIAAVEALAGIADDRARRAIASAASEAPFWAVRRAAVSAMGAWDGEEVTSVILVAASDLHSRVREAAIDALGERRDSERAPYFLERFEADDSYLVQAAAVRALGLLARPEDVEFFRSVEEMSSPRDVLRRAARVALERFTPGADRARLVRD